MWINSNEWKLQNKNQVVRSIWQLNILYCVRPTARENVLCVQYVLYGFLYGNHLDYSSVPVTKSKAIIKILHVVIIWARTMWDVICDVSFGNFVYSLKASWTDSFELYHTQNKLVFWKNSYVVSCYIYISISIYYLLARRAVPPCRAASCLRAAVQCPPCFPAAPPHRAPC